MKMVSLLMITNDRNERHSLLGKAQNLFDL